MSGKTKWMCDNYGALGPLTWGGWDSPQLPGRFVPCTLSAMCSKCSGFRFFFSFLARISGTRGDLLKRNHQAPHVLFGRFSCFSPLFLFILQYPFFCCFFFKTIQEDKKEDKSQGHCCAHCLSGGNESMCFAISAAAASAGSAEGNHLKPELTYAQRPLY